MKEFESYKFNLVTYKEELEAFKQLLTKPNLEESKDILPFFKEKKHLVAQIGTLVPDMQTHDKIALP